MKSHKLNAKDHAIESHPHYWRWIVAALVIAMLAVSAVLLFDDEPQAELLVNPAQKNALGSTSNMAMPKIELKSIQASPFQSQLVAQVLVDGVEKRVLDGQQLRDNLLVKSIDIQGIDLLHFQKILRYELAVASALPRQNPSDSERESVKASVVLLSHEFHSTAEGLEVYSATQQGLSAALGLQNGDRVSKINGVSVTQQEDILRLLKNYHPKQMLEFVGSRQGQTTTWVYQAQADD
jgi:hypothetical protein